MQLIVKTSSRTDIQITDDNLAHKKYWLITRFLIEKKAKGKVHLTEKKTNIYGYSPYTLKKLQMNTRD